MTDINSTIIGGGGDTPTQNTQVNPLVDWTDEPTTGVTTAPYTLSTSAQTIVGAINEILPKATGVGKIDSSSDGTGEIFNSYRGENTNVASGNYSHAEGFNNEASGVASHAEGKDNTASSNYSHAEGNNNTASGIYAHSEGQTTTASGQAAHAEGFATEALGDFSHAEGSNTNASGAYSHAEGNHTKTIGDSEHAEGSYNKTYESEDASVRVIHSVGIGSSEDDRKNAHEIKFNGDHYVYGLGGYDGTNATSEDSKTLQEVINSKQETITPGTGLEFEGNTLNVTLDTTVFKVVSALPDSPAVGDENKIHLVPAESTGANNVYTEYVWVNSAWEILGEYTSEVDLSPYLKSADAADTYLSKTDAAFTYLSKTEASSTYLAKTAAVGKIDSTSDGTGEVFNIYEGDYANVASGSYSHAEGYRNTATGFASHAECNNTNASGSSSHAEGSSTDATGWCSHAEGYRTTASGRVSHAEGANNTASGNYSHAEGWNTQTFSVSEHAEGSYNKSYSSEDASVRVIHSVGIGSSEAARKNAHEIKFNGDHYVYGLGGYDGTNATDAQSLQEVINNKADSTLLPTYTTVPELTAAYTIPANATMVEKIYMITIGATVYDVTGDASIKWAGGVTPTASANSILVVSVLNNLATWQTFI